MKKNNPFFKYIGWLVTDTQNVVNTWTDDVPEHYNMYRICISPDFYYEENEFRYLVVLYKRIAWDTTNEGLSERIRIEVVSSHKDIEDVVREYLHYIHEQASIPIYQDSEMGREANSIAGFMAHFTNVVLDEKEFNNGS